MAIDIIVDVGPQGPQGTPGADGKTVLSGNVNPLSGDGVDGDFYINTTTETIFGPKTAGVWGAGTSLIGPQGPQGPPGAAGNPGGADTQVQFNDAGQFNANSGFTYDKNTNTVTCDNLVIALPTSRFLFTDSASKVITINGWSWDAATTGAQVNLDQDLDDTGGRSVQNYQMNLIPSVASPSSNYNQFNIQTYIDPTSTGFNMGTDGTLANGLNVGFTHQGTSDIGALKVLTSYSNIGNGTDPIDVKGYGGVFVFGDFRDNVNMSGPFQGYIFQPHVHSAASFSTGGAYSNIFNDAANVEPVCDGWNSFNASPNLGGIHNNTNYFGLNVNPNIGVMQGNAQYVGAYLGGAIATMSTGGVTGLQVNPQMQAISSNSKGIGVFAQSVSGTAEWIGVDVSTNLIITTGPIRGIRVNVDGQDLTQDHIALGCDGRVNISSNVNLASGLGQVSIHSMGGQISIPPGVAITGTDTIGNLLAIGVDTGDSSSSWSSTGSPVELSTLGFVGYINGAGTINGTINFCINGYQATHTGHVDRVVNYFAASIPGGAGTMDESILFYGDYPFGSRALELTRRWRKPTSPKLLSAICLLRKWLMRASVLN
jgi:hypothetical protein